MGNYLCGKCRSNTCSHITASTHAMLADRYMKGEVSRAYDHTLDAFRAQMAMGQMIKSVHIPPPVDQSRKKLLLLRR